MLKLIQHLVVNENVSLPETSDCLYAYIMAGNGVFLNARRGGLEVLIPVSNSRIAALPTLIPFVRLSSCVPKNLLFTALELSRRNFPNEMLFWFNLNDRWSIDVPDQLTRPASVMPVDKMDARGTSALIDLHSHGALSPFFSPIDNRDEQGFRIYAVIGEVDKVPKLCVRAGVYGHYFDIPAATVFEMPNDIVDVYEDEGGGDESTVE